MPPLLLQNKGSYWSNFWEEEKSRDELVVAWRKQLPGGGQCGIPLCRWGGQYLPLLCPHCSNCIILRFWMFRPAPNLPVEPLFLKYHYMFFFVAAPVQ
jgi:hypothetical protein